MTIAVIIAVAILIEGLVEYGKNIVDMFYGGDKKTAITQLVTIAVGVALETVRALEAQMIMRNYKGFLS